MTSPSSRDQSIKYDGDKICLELLPPYAINALGAVLTHGAQKYGDYTWTRVSSDRYTGALLRHMMAHMAGEVLDPDSGMPHLWHVLCNATFLVELTKEDSSDVLATQFITGLATSQEEIPDSVRGTATPTDDTNR